MAVTNYRKTGFATLAQATISLVTDLLESGKFIKVFPASAPTEDATTGQISSTTTVNGSAVARWILESTGVVDIKSSQGLSATGTIASSTVTLTFASQTTAPFPVGTLITVAGMTPTGYNGTFTVKTCNTTTVTYDVITAFTGSGTGGKVVAGPNAASAASYTTSDASVLNNSWRICFDFPLADGGTLFKDFLAVYVGTSVQLRNDGAVVALPLIPTTAGDAIKFLEPAGNVGAAYRTIGSTTAANSLKPALTAGGVPGVEPGGGGDVATATSWDIGFYNRIGITKESGYAVPLSYELTTSKRGIFFGMWDIYSEQTGKKFNWVLVQRSVDRATGALRGRIKAGETGTIGDFYDSTATSVSPVWCVNSVNNKYYKFIVREQDVGSPSKRLSATDNTEDSTAIINPFDQQSLTDNSQYVITFLSKLNTTRFKYPDELDMIGTVSSDVIGAGTEATVRVYTEVNGSAASISRVYRALPPNGPFGTGMRVVSLSKFVLTSDSSTSPAGPISEGA